LFDVVNELTAKKKEADELALNQEKELERQREEARRLKAQMATLGGEKDSEQQKLLEELQGLFETEREQLIAEQEQLRTEQLGEQRLKAQKEIERLNQELDDQQTQLSKELSQLENEKRALEEREKERQKKAEQNQKLLKEEAEKKENDMQQQINKLISDLSDAREKVVELESSQSKAALDKMEEKIGKLYWVNKELIQQIKERDTQAKRLQGDLVSLQYEDQLKNLHIDTLDAKGREKQHQRDILLMTKRELEDTNQRSGHDSS
ncbi:uncharacterized protein LOC142357950, partial [Convolutriloba macropyga]|uniref:uncharacterized protein LOC142357950 n=1 Tax=Convolutriloba macropyga TaxID=536237 RepID=UPI003F51E94A